MNSLGSRSDRNISIKYRSCHPSYIERLDLNTCSSSSPGLTGCVTPFAKTDHLWFNGDKEAETMEYEIAKATKEYFNEHNSDGKLRIQFDTSSSDKYYDTLMKIKDNIHNCKYEGTEREPDGMLRIKLLGNRDPLIEL